MARFQRTVAFTVLLATMVLLCVAGILTFAIRPYIHGNRERARVAEAQQVGWHRENVRDLKELSAAVRLTAAEQQRIEQAGDDVERVRKALIDLHEQRLAMWSERLEDAQDRRRELQGTDGYQVYGDHPQSVDVARLIDRDDREATAQVAIFAEALSRIKAWQPMSRERYAAMHPPKANPQQSAAPIVNAAAVEKPSAYVPGLGTSASGGLQSSAGQSGMAQIGAERNQQQSEQAGPSGAKEDLPIPPMGQIPASVTVYAAPAPIVRANPEIVSEPTGQAPIIRVSAPSVEEGVQTTLRRWSTAMVSNDPKAEAAEYAPHMERYFLKMNVDKQFVEADKRDYLRRGNVTADFSLRDVVIESETDATAQVRLVKDVTWQRPSGAEHKLIRSRLLLQKFVDGWKITGEQDFR